MAKIDFDYFKNTAREKLTPKGSSIPHPANWKGRNNTSTPFDNIVTINPEELELNKPWYSEDRSGTSDGRNPTMKRKHVRRVLTDKQKKLAHYLLQGLTKRQAMLRAGYTPTVSSNTTYSNPRLQRVLTYVESLRGKMEKQGLNDDYIAKKFKQWLEAQKVVSARKGSNADSSTDDFIEVPDYDIQIKAYDRYDKVMSLEGKSQPGFKKREISLTEWIKEDSSSEHD